MHYINQDIILIEKKAYIRRGKWKEYAANKAYSKAVTGGSN